MNEDNYDIDEYFQEIRREAAEKERAKIVAWLRKYSVINGLRNDEIMADDIEAGEHLR